MLKGFTKMKKAASLPDDLEEAHDHHEEFASKNQYEEILKFRNQRTIKMKIQPKLVFTHGRQTLIVKTWERISEIDPKEG